MTTSTDQPGACDLCRDIQRDPALGEQHDTRDHTHCSLCPPALLAAETAGRASCSFDGEWRWELHGPTAEDFAARVGANLSAAIKAAGLTTTTLAEQLDPDDPAPVRRRIGKVQRSEAEMRARDAVAWASALGVDPGVFYADPRLLELESLLAKLRKGSA